jgi:DNA-binding NarL/FixJ family response regulator
MTIGVLVADDHELVRAGIRMILEGQEDIRIVGEATDGVQVVAAARETKPDVVLMDIQMPRCNGLEAISALKELVGCPCKVIILTVFSNKEDYVFQALYLGARGFLPKATPPEELIQAIRMVAGGDSLVFPETIRSMERNAAANRDPHVAKKLYDKTSSREREVLSLLARGTPRQRSPRSSSSASLRSRRTFST